MAKYSFGVDVGGTTIKMGLFDLEGNVLDKWEIVTRTENGGVNVLPDIAEAVKGKMSEMVIPKEDVVGVGIGVPGPVDAKGVVHKCVNLGWGVLNINEELGKLLNIPTPYRIELFDNSHLQGSNPVGAMVCYVNGEPMKSMYRKFHLEKEDAGDDYHSMIEVVSRRYRRLKEEISASDTGMPNGNTDLLRRLSNLEKIVYGKE